MSVSCLSLKIVGTSTLKDAFELTLWASPSLKAGWQDSFEVLRFW